MQAKKTKTETRTTRIPTATSCASTVSISAPIHTKPRYSTCARGLREHLRSDAMPRQIQLFSLCKVVPVAVSTAVQPKYCWSGTWLLSQLAC